MGIDSLKPQSFSIFSTQSKTKKLNMPKGAGLTKPMKLSADLAEVVGKKEASRAECIKQLWAYIKKNNLQDPENKQFFVPDKKMAKVFGSDRIRALAWPNFCLPICRIKSFFTLPDDGFRRMGKLFWKIRTFKIISNEDTKVPH